MTTFCSGSHLPTAATVCGATSLLCAATPAVADEQPQADVPDTRPELDDSGDHSASRHFIVNVAGGVGGQVSFSTVSGFGNDRNSGLHSSYQLELRDTRSPTPTVYFANLDYHLGEGSEDRPSGNAFRVGVSFFKWPYGHSGLYYAGGVSTGFNVAAPAGFGWPFITVGGRALLGYDYSIGGVVVVGLRLRAASEVGLTYFPGVDSDSSAGLNLHNTLTALGTLGF